MGLIFKCKYCDTYSTARKDLLERHTLIKHSDEDRKENEPRSKKPRPCTEEGCTYVDLFVSLKRHIQREHEGIILKCHIENCNFETSWTKNLKTHIKTHRLENIKGEPKTQRTIICDQKVSHSKVIDRYRGTKAHPNEMISCVVAECDVKLKGMKNLKRHIADTRGTNKICMPVG